MKIDRLKKDLATAKQKAAEWQARIKDIERQITEQENLEIVQAVRSITASPEELRKILGMIQSMKEPVPNVTENNVFNKKEEEVIKNEE